MPLYIHKYSCKKSCNKHRPKYTKVIIFSHSIHTIRDAERASDVFKVVITFTTKQNEVQPLQLISLITFTPQTARLPLPCSLVLLGEDLVGLSYVRFGFLPFLWLGISELFKESKNSDNSSPSPTECSGAQAPAQRHRLGRDRSPGRGFGQPQGHNSSPASNRLGSHSPPPEGQRRSSTSSSGMQSTTDPSLSRKMKRRGVPKPQAGPVSPSQLGSGGALRFRPSIELISV